MPIPANYFRCAWILTARGNSGPRMVTIAANWTPYLIDPLDFGTPAWFAAAATWAKEAFAGDLAPAFHTSTRNIGCGISIAGGGGSIDYNGNTGTMTGTLAPPEMAIVVQLRTNTVGRKGRGRMFLPDVLEADFNEDGVISSGAQTRAATAVGDLLGGMDGNLVGPFRTGLNGAHILHADGSTPTRITDLGVAGRPGWLRRRGK